MKLQQEYLTMIRYFDEKIESYSPDFEETLKKRLYWSKEKNKWLKCLILCNGKEDPASLLWPRLLKSEGF